MGVAMAKGLGVVLALVSLSIWNAYRSKVNVTRRRNAADKTRANSYYWDLAKPYPNVSSWSDYLLSLSYDKPLTLRGLLVAVVLSKFEKNVLLRWIALAFVGAIPLIGRITIAHEPIQFLSRFEQFLSVFSIGIISSLADWIHHLKPFQIGKGDDALSKFIRAERCLECSPYYDLENGLREATNGLNDVIEPPSGRLLLPTLFPDLCMGPGGLTPWQSEKKSARNKIMAEVFNRLSANLLVYTNVASKAEVFTVKFGAENISSVDELVEKVPGIKVVFSQNCSTFGVAFCVKEGASEFHPLPFFWPGRTSIRDPETGNQLSAVAYHSALVVNADKSCPLGEFRIQFFLGPEGVTGWKAGDEFLRPWAPLVERGPLDAKQSIQALRIAACTGCAVNLAARTQDLAVGGYALHGSCVDTVAMIKQALFGQFDEFPVIASGDSRAGTIAACRHFEDRLSSVTAPSWIKETFRQVSEAAAVLPDDTTVAPNDLIPTIDRFSASVKGDFVHSKQLIQDLASIKTKWQRVLQQ